MLRKPAAILTLALSTLLPATASSAPTSVEMTWMSIANWYFQVGDKRIMMDGYITRVPGPPFFYAPSNFPGDLYAYTKEGYPIDTASITKVHDGLLAGSKLDYMLVGHSH
ncbi:MAG TPA: hypothetical protein VH301_16090, partial [Usitatibacter sp.]|nr:hypothetical protein [Usitatibacter sp.]